MQIINEKATIFKNFIYGYDYFLRNHSVDFALNDYLYVSIPYLNMFALPTLNKMEIPTFIINEHLKQMKILLFIDELLMYHLKRLLLYFIEQNNENNLMDNKTLVFGNEYHMKLIIDFI